MTWPIYDDWAPLGSARWRRHLFLYMSFQTLASGRTQQAVLIDQITGSDYLQKMGGPALYPFCYFGLGDHAPTAPRRRFILGPSAVGLVGLFLGGRKERKEEEAGLS